MRYEGSEKLTEEIIHFIAVELRKKFPKICGAGIGSPADSFSLANPKENKMVGGSIGFQVFTEKELTKGERQEILKLINEKFFDFQVTGQIQILKS